MRTIAASCCTLEPLNVTHAEEMFRVLSDEAIYEFENQAPPSASWLAERYARLERRTSPDGSQTWLNWVLRLPDGELAGYVQATLLASGKALIAYELASRHWRKGIGSGAVSAMLDELQSNYGVSRFAAVLKAANTRSSGLLHRLGFQTGTASEAAEFAVEADELVMVKQAGGESAAQRTTSSA
ncbi:GNAT family N-acetyltransferase [Noviherbaspirillum galbum]|uniref:GNAT family N-acetyltransferase n=1 Tax=Noviherbaspirillum galbum TaxID=2709383 RepID=A0A6B3SWP5_9BURK|nr:GNAT family N-acetyltransferase [Noviherbaspirillum galbum]NEX62149.1 GNAT family N-acetyltransferase [Noviherbaspirillum galbum]